MAMRVRCSYSRESRRLAVAQEPALASAPESASDLAQASALESGLESEKDPRSRQAQSGRLALWHPSPRQHPLRQPIRRRLSGRWGQLDQEAPREDLVTTYP
jgi:hypothetical protein